MSFDFGFTAQDKELVGGSRYADPLGFGPVWTNIARRVVPNLTAQSTRGQGFQLLLCGVDLYERYVEQLGDRAPPEFRDFYIVLEQAFAHSTYAARNPPRWDLPGKRAVRAASGHVRIGLEHQLLDAQLGGGTWGQYAAAAQRSGLISTDPPHLSEELREVVRKGYRSPQFNDELERLFRNLGQGLGGSFAISKATWRDPLARILNKLPHRDLLRERLIARPKYSTPAGYPQAHTALLGEVARRLRDRHDAQEEGDTPSENSFLREFVTECAAEQWDSERFGDARRIFSDMLVCENFLAPLANLFDALFSHHGRLVSDVAGGLSIDVTELLDARDAFNALSYSSHTARARADLYRALDCRAPSALIESLVGIHSKVAKSRGRSPWLLVEKGQLTALIDQDGLRDPDLSPATAWRNSYYLSSLLTLAEDLDVH